MTRHESYLSGNGPTWIELPDKFTGTLLGVWPEDSKEWTEARAQRIGSSDIGVICGWSLPSWDGSPLKTREQLLHTKAGLVEDRPRNKTQARGHYLEDGVARWLADKHDLEYLSGSAGSYVPADPDLWWMLANPDRICANGELAELKTTMHPRSVDHGWGRAGSGQVPLAYQAQCQWAMHVTGLKRTRLGVLAGNLEFASYLIQYDRSVAAWLIEQAQAFRADLQALTLTLERTTAA